MSARCQRLEYRDNKSFGEKTIKKYKIGKFKGGYNYRGYCVYGKTKCWYMKDEDGNPTNGFITLTAFKKWIDALEKNNL